MSVFRHGYLLARVLSISAAAGCGPATDGSSMAMTLRGFIVVRGVAFVMATASLMPTATSHASRLDMPAMRPAVAVEQPAPSAALPDRPEHDAWLETLLLQMLDDDAPTPATQAEPRRQMRDMMTLHNVGLVQRAAIWRVKERRPRV